MSNMENILFGKRNYTILLIALFLIVLGFILMAGGKSVDGVTFNPAIFSTLRIVVAPIVCVTGFVLVIFAIMLKPKGREENNQEEK